MTQNAKSLDDLRSNLTPIENHVIDGYVEGRVSRREFLRHGSLLGLSLPFIGRVALATGFGTASSVARTNVQPGATIRVACTASSAVVIDPVRGAEQGAILMLQQVGEFLCVSGPDLVLKPHLATSWKPNQDGTVWTFTLRKGVKFHSGGEMVADDVVATMDRLADPKNSSEALSVFKGILQKGATRKVDDYTVEFHLDNPNGNFPYLVSSDNYNAIILPANYAGDFEKTWDGTGPFKIDKYIQKSGASFVRNENYWGPKALPAKIEFTFYQDIQPQILALQAGQVDIINKLPAFAGVALLSDPSFEIISIKAGATQGVHLHTHMGPFKDARIRQAVAMSLDREKLVNGLMKGRAVAGNDSPFAPIYPSTDPSVPQRKQDIRKAKELMRAAGVEKGFQATLAAPNTQEIPAFAQLIQSWVKEIGIDLKINIMDRKSYYGNAVPGQSPWFDTEMGIADWGHRSVPNVLLTALLTSTGTWNTAKFQNQEYDTLVKGYTRSFDLDSQRENAGKIQRLLLQETPMLFSYFFDHLTATRKGVVGVQPTARAQLFLHGAGVE